MAINTTTGKIGVNVGDIFPVIKKFLYSDHEIFLRELVSNAVDATQKLKAIRMSGTEDVPEIDDAELKVTVSVDEENGTITVSDRGIGMTQDEIERYINQIAFSGASDFLERFKDTEGIIGHFGLGFYSSFMVSKKVEIVTRSYKKDAPVLRWSCDGSPEFQIDDITEDNAGRPFGTDVILYLDDESKSEFGTRQQIRTLLEKYCKFMAVPVTDGKKQKWDAEQKKNVDTEEDHVINAQDAIWTKNPADLTDEDYKSFYSYLYPGEDEPQFWIRLNVSEPFTLKGVLFFPKTRDKEFMIRRNRIQLYCNQVFVTDIMEGIVPDFMQLLFGVIDSPDIPLNVSRSYLQADKDVKKISGYITKKVADKLKELLKNDRKKYEEIWDDLKTFINYGLMSEDSFYDRAKDAYMLEDVDGKFFTLDEYKTLIETEQKDKDDTLVYLYTTDADEQYTAISAARDKGYSVIKLQETSLDLFAVQTLEQKLEKTRFARVDSDIITNLIKKDDERPETSEADADLLRYVFNKKLSSIKDSSFVIGYEHLGDSELPVIVTQNEWSRRMKDNSKYQSQSWYMNIPDSYMLTLNADSDVVKNLLTDIKEKTGDTVKPLDETLKTCQDALTKVTDELREVKWDERTEEQKKTLEDAQNAVNEVQTARNKVYDEYDNKVIPQLIDLGLLGIGKLTGENLYNFLKRSAEFIK